MNWRPKKITFEDLNKKLNCVSAQYLDWQKKSEGIIREVSREKRKKGLFPSIWKRVKFVTGVKGFQDKHNAKGLNESTGEMYDAACKVTNLKREIIGLMLQDLGNLREKQYRETIGVFLGYLKDINQKNAEKEYQFINGIDVEIKHLKDYKVSVNMPTPDTIDSAIKIGALGLATASSTPALVTATVAQLATASTGTAISGLQGAAATNATLAWLGGGSIASGGGGIAAGTAALGTITVAATGAVALLAAGCIASTRHSNILTKAVKNNENVAVACGNMEIAWTKMDGIKRRVLEMKDVMDKLSERIKDNLAYLAPLIPDFEKTDPYFIKTFQSTAILIVAMGRLSDAPILGDDAELSSESVKLIQSTQSILNKELLSYEH